MRCSILSPPPTQVDRLVLFERAGYEQFLIHENICTRTQIGLLFGSVVCHHCRMYRGCTRDHFGHTRLVTYDRRGRNVDECDPTIDLHTGNNRRMTAPTDDTVRLLLK